jgi:hypothetical protein
MSRKPSTTEKAGHKYTALAGLLVVAGALACVRPAMAQDVKSYTRATFDQWLAKYKDAKPDFKVGDVLTAKDIERIRPFIFPGYLEQLNFPEFKMEIGTPVDHTPRKDYMACTEKYQSQVRLLPDKTMANYVCGQPFPNSAITESDPDAGWKAAWNYEYRWQNFGLFTIPPATWVRFGGTHEIPKWDDPPSDWMASAGVQLNFKVPSDEEMKLDLRRRRPLPAHAERVLSAAVLHSPRHAGEPHLAGARCQSV